MRSFFSPAIFVLNRLSYRKKFAFIGVLFALPLAVALYLLITEINLRIDFTKKEVAGNAYLRPLRFLLEDLQFYRGMTYAVLRGGSGSDADALLVLPARVDKDMQAIAEADRLMGPVFLTTVRWAALWGAWQNLRGNEPRISPREEFDRHTQVIDELLTLMQEVGDSSTLILDPDLDSYYLMDTVLDQLPHQIEQLAQMRDLGAAMLEDPTMLQGQERFHLDNLFGLIELLQRGIRRNFIIALRENPEFRPNLETQVEDSLTATNEFLALVKNELLNPEHTAVPEKVYWDTGTRATNAGFTLYDSASTILDRVLQARIDRLSHKRFVAAMFTLAMMLVVLHLGVAFYLATMETVARLRQVTNCATRGKMDEMKGLIEAKDEMGQITHSFTLLIQRLQEECVLTQTNERLALLQADVGQALAHETETRMMLNTCCQALVDHLDAAFAQLWTWNSAENVLELGGRAGTSTHVDFGRYEIDLIAKERKPHFTNAVVGDRPVGHQAWATRKGIVSFAGYPLIVQDDLIGVMALYADHPLSEATLEGMSNIAYKIVLGLERRKADETLRESEEAKRLILDSALDAVVMMNADGVIKNWNPQAVTVFGWTAEEAIGRRVSELIIPEGQREAHERGMKRFLQTGQHAILNKRIEVNAIHKSGRLFPVELSIVPLSFRGVYAFNAFIRDITDRKSMEEQILQTEKLAALGTLIDGVSHELNNPLFMISGFAQLGKEICRSGQYEKVLGSLESIESAAQQMTAIVSRFVAMAKPGPMEVRECDVNAILNEALWLLKNDYLRHEIDVIGELHEKLPTVSADAQELAQVFVNLLTNARQALGRVEHKRHLLVKTGLMGVNSESCIEIRITDNGPGISPEKLPHIFEPFYTNRIDGTGAGLGLSMCHRMISSIHGTIQVESELGKGATFIIHIPGSHVA